MYGRERRHAGGPAAVALRAGLNQAQLKTLSTMEQFKWTLRFVRRPLFQDPQINETPDFKVRG
jgi:hypothetical protein